MTRLFSLQEQGIAAGLILEAGTGLHSIVRETGVTCPVCATPLTPGYQRCRPCEIHPGSGLALADRVGSLIYALEGDSQVYKIVQNYKAPAYEETSLPRLMQAMLAIGLRTHYTCVGKISGEGEKGWCVVPSTRGRTKLRELVLSIGAPPSDEVVVEFSGSMAGRTIRPERWTIESETPLPAHVVVVDDSWVTGSNAQSLAAALKIAGVSQVSVFTVARVMNPGYAPNAEFIRTRLSGTGFMLNRCPWTDGLCPV